ncbi:hypothetical protein PALU110988_03240 [Paenibacillus lupini]|nr:hypothetical protein [Paenibacillus lupini]
MLKSVMTVTSAFFYAITGSPHFLSKHTACTIMSKDVYITKRSEYKQLGWYESCAN